MKYITIVLFLMAFSVCGKAQSTTYTFKYEYDNAGNRLHRYLYSIEVKGAEQAIAMKDSLSGSFPGKVSLYPNPTQGLLKVKIEMKQVEPATIMICDINGRKLKEETISGNESIMDITNFPAGEYLMKIGIKGRYQLFKVIKK